MDKSFNVNLSTFFLTYFKEKYSNYIYMKYTNDVLLKWWNNKSVNPITKRKIKEKGKVWNNYLKLSLLNNVMKDQYHEYHNKLEDPLLKTELETNLKLFKFKYCWDPLNGSILGKDYRGCLYFDPDILIHYFYTNKLSHLWIESNSGYSGNYGEGLGNGPDFFIKGRGSSPHWYLFRLPLINAYCNLNKIGQQTTLTPILTKKNIINIYNTAKKNKDNYKKLFNKDRPNLIKIYELYQQAIKKPIYNEEIIKWISKEEIKYNYMISNMSAVNTLRTLY